jgi:hypothetical protein
MTTMVLTLNFSGYLVSVEKIFVCMCFLVGSGLFAVLIVDFFITPIFLARANPFGKEEQA